MLQCDTKHCAEVRSSKSDQADALVLWPPQTVAAVGLDTRLPTERYQFVRHIRRALFGAITLALDTRTERFVVVKQANYGSLFYQLAGIENVDREIKLQQACEGAGVVKLVAAYRSPAVTNLYAVMEYAPLGDLFDHLENTAHALPLDVSRSYFRQIATAVQRMHSRHIVNMDLSLENILRFEDGTVKICDFGQARRLRTRPNGCGKNTSIDIAIGANAPDANGFGTKSRTGGNAGDIATTPTAHSSISRRLEVKMPFAEASALLGTAHEVQSQDKCVYGEDGVQLLRRRRGKDRYAAPELWVTPLAPYDGRACDMFALGPILFTMLIGLPPFDSATKRDLRYRYIAEGRIAELLASWKYPCLSSDLLDLLHRLMHPDPAKRITSSEVLKHPWLQDAV